MNSEIRRKKIISLKSSITNQQSFFTKPLQQHKAAVITSYEISHLLAKNKKSFTDGELVKEAMLEAADSLFEEFKNKKEIVSAINTLQLSARTVTRRIEVIVENLEAELANDMENCIFFSLQMDKSTDWTNISQLAICVKMAFSDFTTKEEFLKVLSLKGSTRGEDSFSTFKKYITDVKLPVQKLSSITTDGAPAMTEIIDKLIEEFSSRFEDFAALEPVLRFFINPFNVTEDDVLEIVSVYFELHNIEDLELEIINLQSDIILKAHSNDKMFWNLVDENKYPILRKCALKIYSYCATTYNCESLFSNMKYLKSKYRTKLNDLHLDNCLRTGNSKYIPNYKKLAENMDTQVSH
ncbi:uncharacterized protein TNCT_143011 [Trichonephila clavata]|uniref:HAT C-terminal dimerisation domain-containing protein n=1 Tax=Trichonephila clavata TaxID=2740835 RepID=A0A8X6KI81_TRICU|nr:uncharacterized protein TNCT_143011 [Trichonephila clavata]